MKGKGSLGRQLAASRGPGEDTGPEQPVEEFVLEEAAGEAPAELGEIGLEMLREDPVMHPPEHALYVGTEYMHSGELPPRLL